ncbi:hypothetical protein NI17_021775 [Thermobifida halotolerans]|uniref:Uncharacterized protein n=1 Tax=Thermobifida halotolerans TaxID=483545 RepID=A0AA97M3U0_9ACTN|nr:hypothetical protein [Thermobifida halotolerans]UOE19331.1 hypothetical protein NI17_021775 [Thermobifida halotolerans]
MDTVTITAAGQESVIDIPLPTEAWHETVDESVQFEVQQASLAEGHFGTNFRRC